MQIDFTLPEELIATHPTQKRDQCKLLVYDRKTQKIQHAMFHELGSFLSPDHFLVLNQAKVSPCRIFWTDAKLKRQEIVFLKMIDEHFTDSTWEAIVSGSIKPGQPHFIFPGFEFTMVKEREGTVALIKVNKNKAELEKILAEKGQLALPPYIVKKRTQDGQPEYTSNDKRDYQTVYCKKVGAIAAPTAGLHFTNETFSSLEEKGIAWDYLHLAVGWGTFEPLTVKHFVTKKLHAEHLEITPKTAQNIIAAVESGKKILGVGTTVVRSLETWAQQGKRPGGTSGDADMFIFPPFDFQVVQSMVTNFHIPKSSVLYLVAAFLGENGDKKILEIYEQAIEKKYRFYSYGDAMLIL